MIVNENNLLEYIKTSQFIDNIFRNTLLKYFDKIEQEEILLLVKYFNIQRQEVLILLTRCKDGEVCSFEDIKTNIDNTTRMKIKLEEKEELKSEEDEFLALVNSINNL
jgi:hypothetical protein